MPKPDQPSLLACWQRVLSERRSDTAVIDFATGGRHTFADIEAEAIAIEHELRAALTTGAAQDPLPASAIAQTPSDTAAPVVLLCLPNGARWLSASLAIRRCHAVLAPLEPEPDSEALTTKHAALALRLRAVARIDTSGIHPIPPTQQARDDAQQAGNDAQQAGSDVQQTGANARQTRGNARQVNNNAPRSSQTPYLIKLTSGSSGEPKALPFTEGNMVADGLNIITTMGLAAHSLNYAAIPFGHSYGLGNLVLPFFLQGTAIACASSILPRVLATEIAACSATFFPAVPTLARALCAAQVQPQQLATLERVICAGSVLQPQTAQEFYALYGKRLHNFYGSSETGGICFDPNGEATLSGRSVGRALANVSLAIDAEGHVQVQSAAVCAALADARQRLSLPDCGTLLANGELQLTGRSGREIKIGARRLDLNTWEAQVRALPGIEDAYACQGTRPGGETLLCAALQTQQPPTTVREQLAHALPRWQQPGRLLILSAFPQTARGKTNTAALHANFQQGSASIQQDSA